ncbi:hypothetical protein K438DRAFT_1758718 [Mycena galopus ATCC 62051]|nr:hypothetical protein K438DRAFT_1758718 [Mycena galopus ATCC 62051]
MPASSSAPAVLQQVLPVLLFFVLPYLALRFFAFARPRAGSAQGTLTMELGHRSLGTRKRTWERKRDRDGTGKRSDGRRVRTRAEQVAESKRGEKTRAGDAETDFPGLVNMSGTHCFMNSTLQSSRRKPEITPIYREPYSQPVPPQFHGTTSRS